LIGASGGKRSAARQHRRRNVNAQHLPGRADALGERDRARTGTAADIDDTLALPGSLLCSWSSNSSIMDNIKAVQHLDDIEIPIIEIGPGWTVDTIATDQDCDDAFA
jgi:hypothetical protein